MKKSKRVRVTIKNRDQVVYDELRFKPTRKYRKINLRGRVISFIDSHYHVPRIYFPTEFTGSKQWRES